jgi:hypothetical protein
MACRRAAARTARSWIGPTAARTSSSPGRQFERRHRSGPRGTVSLTPKTQLARRFHSRVRATWLN